MFNKIKNIFMSEKTIVPEIVTPVDSSTLEVSANDWNITVSDKEGNVVEKFNDITKAMDFATANGYSLHAE